MDKSLSSSITHSRKKELALKLSCNMFRNMKSQLQEKIIHGSRCHWQLSFSFQLDWEAVPRRHSIKQSDKTTTSRSLEEQDRVHYCSFKELIVSCPEDSIHTYSSPINTKGHQERMANQEKSSWTYQQMLRNAHVPKEEKRSRWRQAEAYTTHGDGVYIY